MESDLLQMIYKKYSREIFLYLVSLCHSTTMAEDLMQDVFLKAMLSLDERHTNFRAWLYLVARNLCFNELQKGKHQELVEDVPEQIIHDPSVESVLLDEKQRILYEAMLKLEPRSREILTMQYFSEWKINEIAIFLKLSPDNVRVLSYRAKKRLKQIVEEMGYEI